MKPTISQAAIEAFDSLSQNGFNKFGSVKYSQTQNGAEAKIEATGSRNFYNPQEPIDAQTIVGIGSITKQFTAATLLKLWDNEITARPANPWFDAGIETKLAKFMPALTANYPECAELFARIAADENYSKITLRDLLNHTHGLGARDNDEATKLVRAANGAPLQLSAIANVTKKRDSEKYGEHHYGNFGYDLSAMIVETVAGRKFDDVVKALVLTPNHLDHTHPQSDHAALYANPQSNIATGYAADSADITAEFKMNGTSNTVAAGGFKSTVGDLAKFASLFMGAQMFENSVVKEAITNRANSARLGPSASYHLAIQEQNGLCGHSGMDIIFSSDLNFNPQTKAVEVSLNVADKIIDPVAKNIFDKVYPGHAGQLDEQQLWENSKFRDELEATNGNKPGSAESILAITQTLQKNPETLELINKYLEIREKVSAMPRDQLVGNVEGVIAELSRPAVGEFTRRVLDKEQSEGVSAQTARS